jgi:hypothetical protein
MNAGGEGNPKSPENQTPQSPEPGATEGLPPDQPLPPAAEMLRRASGSSIDSFSGEGADLSLLVAEQFQMPGCKPAGGHDLQSQ